MLARRVTARVLSHGPAVSRFLRTGVKPAANGPAALFPPAFAGAVGFRGRGSRWASPGPGGEGKGTEDGAVEEETRELTAEEKQEQDVQHRMVSDMRPTENYHGERRQRILC